MISQRLLSSFVLILLLLVPALAQTPEDQSPLDQQEKQEKALELKKEVERKTLSLLDEVIGSAVTLKNPENRALVLTGAADLLWTRDEKRARSLFKDALNNLNSIAIRFDEKMSDEQRASYWKLAQQRKEILQMIARRDADMALDLLRASRSQTSRRSAKGFQQPDEDRQLEQSLAIQVAANDPKRALQMAEDSLSKGLTPELLNLLARLNDKDTELAGHFAADLINKLHSENLATNKEAAWLAVLLLRMGIHPETADGPTIRISSYDNVGKTPFKLDEPQVRDLLEMVTAVAVNSAPNAPIFTLLPSLMPEIEKRLPERATILRRRIAENARTLDPRERMFVEYQELIQRGTVDALLEAAAKAPDKARGMLYEQAGWKALYRGDTERARQIINDNIRDSASRDRILESFDQVAIWNSMRKEKLDEVRGMLARMTKSKDQRASVLAQLAWGAALKKDRKLALELLDEARQFVTLKPKNDTQLYALLQVVRAYALVEPNRAFEMIESLVEQANDLLSAASVLSGFLLPPGMFRKGEFMLTPGYSQISMQFRQFGKELAALALVNFERTKADADKFQRNETRIMARLFIAQGVLSEQLGSGVALYEGGVMLGY
jgi:hypothetical protein